MEVDKPSDKSLKLTLRRASMDLLARREHARIELSDKLRRKFPEQEPLFDAVLDQLEADNLLSDSRFAEAYVRYRKQKGFGPLMLQQELRMKGVAQDLIDEYVDARSNEWQQTLEAVLAKKRRLSSEPETPQAQRKLQQKLYRFCLSRGFSADMISRLLFRR
jgi:regulatory protein